MGHSTYTRGELTISDAAVAQWAHELTVAPCDDASTALVDQLTSLIAEDAYHPIEVHRTDEGLHVELHGDYLSRGLKSFLDQLARSGATGRIWFPEDGMWGYTLALDGAIEQNGAQVYPGDEMLLLTIEIPGKERHRAIYAEAEDARQAIDRHLAAWAETDRRSADLDAALVAVICAGGTATCEALSFGH